MLRHHDHSSLHADDSEYAFDETPCSDGLIGERSSRVMSVLVVQQGEAASDDCRMTHQAAVTSVACSVMVDSLDPQDKSWYLLLVRQVWQQKRQIAFDVLTGSRFLDREIKVDENK